MTAAGTALAALAGLSLAFTAYSDTGHQCPNYIILTTTQQGTQVQAVDGRDSASVQEAPDDTAATQHGACTYQLLPPHPTDLTTSDVIKRRLWELQGPSIREQQQAREDGREEPSCSEEKQEALQVAVYVLASLLMLLLVGAAAASFVLYKRRRRGGGDHNKQISLLGSLYPDLSLSSHNLGFEGGASEGEGRRGSAASQPKLAAGAAGAAAPPAPAPPSRLPIGQRPPLSAPTPSNK